MNADDFVGGHSILALERFMDETRHMIIFDVLSWKSPVGEKGERLRLFLSDVGYAKAQASERRGEIKIRKHAAVIEGHKYENFDKLTIAMLNEFIEKILVHERDRKGSIQTTQEVEIYFNFVGRFVPPAFGEVELTPEELEEIRKREERKDRLHQNYLKRKASGAQKRYEDKIKGRKKAEIEAKKAAIRAEDIAKGVFVPVSSLPQREPMKGVQTA